MNILKSRLLSCLLITILVAGIFFLTAFVLINSQTTRLNVLFESGAEQYRDDVVRLFRSNGYLIENTGTLVDGTIEVEYSSVCPDISVITTPLIIERFFALTRYDSQINRLDESMEAELFRIFQKVTESDGVRFADITDAQSYERVLLRKSDGKPIVFYKLINFNENTDKSEQAIISFDVGTIIKPVEFVTLGFAGDLVLEEYARENIDRFGIDYPLDKVRLLLEAPDIMGVNLECAISDRGSPEPKAFRFRGRTSDFEMIVRAGIDYLATANNHALDYGVIAMSDTIDTIKVNGLKYSGTGETVEEAFSPALFDLSGSKIALFSIADVPDEYRGYRLMDNFKVTDDKGGIAYYDLNRLKLLFDRYKAAGYTIIVNLHTGNEYRQSPDDAHKRKARGLIDAGSDAIIGHHPHVVNGVEIYNGRIIAYSLGDFMLYIGRQPRADEGMIVYLYLVGNQILSWSFYPTVCNNGVVSMEEWRLDNAERHFILLTEAIN